MDARKQVIFDKIVDRITGALREFIEAPYFATRDQMEVAVAEALKSLIDRDLEHLEEQTLSVDLSAFVEGCFAFYDFKNDVTGITSAVTEKLYLHSVEVPLNLGEAK